MLFKSLFLTFAILSGAASAADDCATNAAVSEAQEFFVSGVLRKNGEDVTIKLLHAVERAASTNEALGAFVAKAQAEYPNYAVLDTLVSPSNAKASITCIRPVTGVAI